MGTAIYIPVFVVEIVFVERTNEFLVFLFHRLQIDIFSSRVTVRVKIVRKENADIIETFHDNFADLLLLFATDSRMYRICTQVFER